MTQINGYDYDDKEDKGIDPSAPYPMNMPVKKRLELLRDLIVDKMIEDKRNGYPLLKKIQKEKSPPKPPKIA